MQKIIPPVPKDIYLLGEGGAVGRGRDEATRTRGTQKTWNFSNITFSYSKFSHPCIQKIGLISIIETA